MNPEGRLVMNPERHLVMNPERRLVMNPERPAAVCGHRGAETAPEEKMNKEVNKYLSAERIQTNQ